MKLYVIRHGETEWNKRAMLQGHEGSDLTEKGVSEAEKTAKGMRGIPLDLCFSSPLIRTVHTARIILKGRNVPVIQDPRIMEIGFGVWEGIDLRKLSEGPEADNWNAFMENPFAYRPPEGAESIRQVIDRTGAFLDDVAGNPEFSDMNILISTHGCAGRALLNHVYEDKKDFWHGGVPKNCAVSIISTDGGRPFLLESDVLYY